MLLVSSMLFLFFVNTVCSETVYSKTRDIFVGENDIDKPLDIYCLPDDFEHLPSDIVTHWTMKDNTTIMASTPEVDLLNDGFLMRFKIVRWTTYGTYTCFVMKLNGDKVISEINIVLDRKVRIIYFHKLG